MNESALKPLPPAAITLKEFFEGTSPGKNVVVNAIGRKLNGSMINVILATPVIELHCDDNACEGKRFFEPNGIVQLQSDQRKEHFVTFVCRNCKRSKKTYAFSAWLSSDNLNGELMKFGEDPPFGPPVPAQVMTLIGAEREYYLKGRRSENQGLGIAAFAYYRRAVENQKSRIIGEVLRVAQKAHATDEVINGLIRAKTETQFSKAVEAVKHGIPQSLLIDGHNPLTLLHTALSEGLHAQSDEDCLVLATSIRVVLTELVERIAIALKEEKELSTAVSKLLQVSANKAARG